MNPTEGVLWHTVRTQAELLSAQSRYAVAIWWPAQEREVEGKFITGSIVFMPVGTWSLAALVAVVSAIAHAAAASQRRLSCFSEDRHNAHWFVAFISGVCFSNKRA